MHKLETGNISFEFAEKWNELTRDRLLEIAELYLLGLSETVFRFYALFILMKASVMRKDGIEKDKVVHYVVKRGDERFLLSAIVVQELIGYTDFLLKESELTRNLLEWIKVDGRKYYGPADGFYNMTFEEWTYCEQSYAGYSRSKNINDLNKMLAVMYRPEVEGYDPDDVRFNGDRREVFNDFLIDRRIEIMKLTSNRIRFAVLLYFQGCQRLLIDKFPLVFTKAGGKDDGLGFLSLVDYLNGGDVTKNEKIRKQNLWDVMTRLQKIRETANEIKKHKQRRK